MSQFLSVSLGGRHTHNVSMHEETEAHSYIMKNWIYRWIMGRP